ncbi:MAG TPA: DUF2478 domain-containing protein [Caulobacteraceae bacterium]|jgi:hypothetical protein|nr:DUF2478 domain-containing protein [Caulobacteraceae bacterium]
MASQIAVVQGAAGAVVQGLLRAFVAGLPPSVRLAGVIEDPFTPQAGECAAGDLRSLSDGRRFQMMQDLGPGAAACRLDSDGVVSACEAVLQGIAAGCGLVVLNKFGKIEASRSGLAQAFAGALERGLPILTSVAPKFTDAWDRFAAPYYVVLPPELGAIEAWWRALENRPRSPDRPAEAPQLAS